MSSSPPQRLHLLAITWPIFVENLLMAVMGLFGLWMASRLSDGTVAAFGLSNQILGALQILFRVLSIGTSVVVTQHQGAGDPTGAKNVAKAGMSAAIWVGLITLLCISLGAAQLLSLLHLPPELMPIAQPFMMSLGFALMIDAVAMTMIAVLRAHTYTQDSMRIVLMMNAVHVAVSIPLMLGVGQWPGFGLLGMGIAMAISRLFGLVMLRRAWRIRLNIQVPLREMLRIKRAPLKSILHIGLPGAGEKISYRISFLMSMAMVASMGAVPLATHTYVWQSVALVTLFVNSVGFGTEIVIGHLVGAGRLSQANRVMWRATLWGLGVTILCTITSYFVTPLMVARVTQDPQILMLVASVMVMELILEPGRTFNLVVASGLRASGDVRYPVKVSIICVFVMCTGLGWLLGIHFNMGLIGMWIGYAADEWSRGLCMLARWYWRGWVPYGRHTRRRILSHKTQTQE